MFEKEAEEYTIENVCSTCYFEKPCENKCEAFGCADSKTCVLKAFKDGAEFGYNKANEAIADKLLITAKYNEVLNDLNQENDRVQKENAELKCECRRCVYTDSPCILSDYGKDRNGICDHFKDVFDEIVELKSDSTEWERASDKWKKVYELTNNQLTKAREIIKGLLSFVDSLGNYSGGIFAKAEQFLKDCEVEK